MKQLLVLFLLFTKIIYESNEIPLYRTVSLQKETRSLFNQIKSFAKELIKNNGNTDVAHLLVEHIENCQYFCENEGFLKNRKANRKNLLT
jgi:hypothetical protein